MAELIRPAFTFMSANSLRDQVLAALATTADQLLPSGVLDLLSSALASNTSEAGNDGSLPELGFLDVIGVTEFSTSIHDGVFTLRGAAYVLPGYAPTLAIPGVPELTLLIQRLGTLDLLLSATDFQLTLVGPSIKLRFDRTWLRPVREENSRYAEIELIELGRLSVDRSGNLELAALPGGRLRFVTNNDPWYVGNTKMTLETGELDVILWGSDAPRVTLSSATLRLPDSLSAKDPEAYVFKVSDACIDRGGFSGKVSVRFEGNREDGPADHPFSGPGVGSLLGLDFALDNVELELKNNLPVASSIKGRLLVPYFKEKVGCELSLASDGDFAIGFTDTDADGLITWTSTNGIAVTLDAFAIARVSGLTTLTVGGQLTPGRPDSMLGDMPKIHVKGLSITSAGDIALAEGRADFDPPASFELYGFVATINQVWLSFAPDEFSVAVSGGIALVDDLPKATIQEARFSYVGDNRSFSLKGASLDAAIGEEIRLFGGFHVLDGPNEGFAGDLNLNLQSIGLQIEAAMAVGYNKDEGFPFLYLYADVELPAGIPLTPLPVSIFGFGGMFAFAFSPTRKSSPPEHWYYSWYRGPPAPGATQTQKWEPRRGAIALGFGVTLGTNDGSTLVVRALLVLNLNPFSFLLLGRGGWLLKDRSSLGDSPPLTAMLALDSEALLIDLEAQYEFVKDVLFAQGVLDSLFPFSGSGWHIYLGENVPGRFITADILKGLFSGTGYVMLDASALQFGAAIGYKLDEKYGPCTVKVDAHISATGKFSFGPVQYSQLMEMVGAISLRAYGAGLTLNLTSSIDVLVPTPWFLSLHVTAELDLPWPLGDLSVDFDITWQEEILPPYPAPLLTDAQSTPAIGLAMVPLVLAASDDPPITEDVPLDARIGLTFARTMSGGTVLTKIAGWSAGPVHRVGDERFIYEITALTLTREEEFGVALADGEVLSASGTDARLFGHWQLQPGRPESGATETEQSPGNTLWLLARTPFPYLQYQSWANDGTTSPGPLPNYAATPTTAPAEEDIDLCNLWTAGDRVPSDGETASGEADPALPSVVTTREGARVVSWGFPEANPAEGTVTDPNSGNGVSVDVIFPRRVIITGPINPGSDGTYTPTDRGHPSPPAPTKRPPRRPTPPETTTPWTRVPCWLRFVVGLFAIVLLAIAFGTWLATQKVPSPAWLIILVALLLTAAALWLVLWWCRSCGRSLRVWLPRRVRLRMRRPRRAHPLRARRAAALALFRRVAVVMRQPPVSTRTFRTVGRPRASTAAPPGAADDSVALAGAVYADRIHVESAQLACQTLHYQDAATADAYASATAVNELRAGLAANFVTTAAYTLTNDALVLRRDSQYLLSLTVTKTGRGDELETYTTRFRTIAAPPADLTPYVHVCYPRDERVPFFRASDVGVRMLESYVRQMYEDVSEMPLELLLVRADGTTVEGRSSIWVKAAEHIDQDGALAFLNAVNETYEAELDPNGAPRDDVLLSRGDPLEASAIYDVVVVGPTTVFALPLYRYRMRTSRYSDLAELASHIDPHPTIVASTIPTTLWARTGTFTTLDLELLDLFKEPLPEHPTLRLLTVMGGPQVLLLTFPEPMPAAIGDQSTLRAGEVGCALLTQVQIVSALPELAYLAVNTNPLIPLGPYKGQRDEAAPANPHQRLVRDRSRQTGIDLPPTSTEQSVGTVVWTEDGTRAFIIVDQGEAAFLGTEFDLELRYLRAFPTDEGAMVLETKRVHLELS